MRPSAELLAAFETCPRRGHWSLSWESNRMTDTEMLQGALREAMLSSETDIGELAGSVVMGYAHERGVETRSHSPYQVATSTACLADMLALGIRQSRREAPWRVPETLAGVWTPGCLLSPDSLFLRRFVLASSWSEDRQLAEVNSWKTQGEIAHYELPMQLVVCVIGPSRDGKRHSHFTKGLRHPKNGKLRFRKKSNTSTTDFKTSWLRVWREDVPEVETYQWIQAMAEDDVLRECLFVIDVPIPSDIRRIRELVKRKLEKLQKVELPEPQLTGCWWPNRCPFIGCCWGRFQEPSEKAGFMPISIRT